MVHNWLNFPKKISYNVFLILFHEMHRLYLLYLPKDFIGGTGDKYI